LLKINCSIFSRERRSSLYWEWPRCVKHPPKIHAQDCFSKEGFGKLLFFKKNLTGPRLIELYERGLLPTALEQFRENKDDWILMEDNGPKHTSKVAKNWKIANDLNRLPWPSQSPDLNPIENVFFGEGSSKLTWLRKNRQAYPL